MFEKLPLPAKKALAWSVHFFTATGAVWGFLTLLAIFEQNWRAGDYLDDRRHVRGWLRWDVGALVPCEGICQAGGWRPDGQYYRLPELCCRCSADPDQSTESTAGWFCDGGCVFNSADLRLPVCTGRCENG